MAADPRHPFESLQFGVLRVSGVSSEWESSDQLRLHIDRIELRDVKLQTPLGAVSAASAVLTNVTAWSRTAPQGDGPLGRFARLTVGELRLEGANVEQVSMPAQAGATRRTPRT